MNNIEKIQQEFDNVLVSHEDYKNVVNVAVSNKPFNSEINDETRRYLFRDVENVNQEALQADIVKAKDFLSEH